MSTSLKRMVSCFLIFAIFSLQVGASDWQECIEEANSHYDTTNFLLIENYTTDFNTFLRAALIAEAAVMTSASYQEAGVAAALVTACTACTAGGAAGLLCIDLAIEVAMYATAKIAVDLGIRTTGIWAAYASALYGLNQRFNTAELAMGVEWLRRARLCNPPEGFLPEVGYRGGF